VRLRFSPSVAEALRASALPVVVTGGSGWLGRASLEMLDAALGSTFAERVRVFGSSERELLLRSGRAVKVLPLPRIREVPATPSLILHFAFLSRDRLSELTSEAFLAGNERIGQLVEAATRRSRAPAILVPSSGAIHGNDAYAVAKRRQEECFRGSGARVVAPRIHNLAGPFINKPEHYALASIVRAVLAGDVVRLRAGHPVVRGYVHVRDLLDLCAALLLDRRASEPFTGFDAAGEPTLEIGELAERVAAVLGAPRVRVERPPPDGRPPDVYSGDPRPLMAYAARYRIRLAPLDEQIRDTAAYLAEEPVS